MDYTIFSYKDKKKVGICMLFLFLQKGTLVLLPVGKNEIGNRIVFSYGGKLQSSHCIGTDELVLLGIPAIKVSQMLA